MTPPTTSDMALAAQIAATFLRQTVEEVTPINNKGIVNQIFIVRTRDSAIVVRMSKPEDESRSLPFYEKEAWCLERATALGIPGPQVLEVGQWGTRPYMLQTFVAGVNGEDSELDELGIWHALGQYAKLFHAIPLDGFGETLADFYKGNAQAEWKAFVDYNLNSLTTDDQLLRLDIYDYAQVEDIRQVFQTLRQMTLRIGLNHYDLSIRNTVVDETGQVNLLDWGSAEAHLVPHYDLLEILRHYQPSSTQFQAFMAGYGLDEAQLASLLPEIRSLELLKAFDLTRWAIDRCPERIEEIAAQARQVVSQHFTTL